MRKHMIKFALAFALCLMIVPTNTFASSEQEPNNEYETATVIEPNAVVNASFANTYNTNSLNYDYDWYKITLTQPGCLRLSFERPSKANLLVEVYSVDASSSLTKVYNRVYTDVANPVSERVTQTCDSLYFPAGDYYIKTFANARETVNKDYVMTASYTAYPEYGSIEYEPNNDYSESTEIKLNTKVKASFTNGYRGNAVDNDYDWYKLSLKQPGTIRLLFERPAQSSVVVEIYSVDASSSLKQLYKDVLERINNPVEEYVSDECDGIHVSAGDYYIKLYAGIRQEILSDYSFIVSDPANLPSEWAANDVTAAIAAGLVPANLQQNYQQPVSRGNIAQMFINLIEKRSGQTIDNFMAANGFSINSGAFTDTSDRAVLAANALGIISGVGGGRFDPNGTLTRAQIAAIINRVAGVLGVDTDGFSHSFSDVGDHWAGSELGWPAQSGIITGVGNNRFDPDGKLTTEQAIAITYRAFQYLSAK